MTGKETLQAIKTSRKVTLAGIKLPDQLAKTASIVITKKQAKELVASKALSANGEINAEMIDCGYGSILVIKLW